ncbi:MAG TPA: hypothetical protein VJ851_10910 [Jatrophihabitans sp.]|nr:hypothetical protein [Jatrophihabitans sp.]
MRHLLCPVVAVVALVCGLATNADAGTSPVGGRYSSYAYLAISRTGAAVYVNALLHQDSATGIAAGPDRTVYLQRLLTGHWQNVLARQTDARGRFTVGFPSAPSFSYRLVAAASNDAWGATSGTATSPLLGTVLHPGQSLVAGAAQGSSLTSPSGQFRLTAESVGAFGLTQDAYLATAEWTISATVQEVDGLPSPIGRDRLTMLTNGDLALISAAGKPLWSSHTSGAGNSLYLQDDGNLVIYSPLSRALWASHTTAVVLLPGTIVPAGTIYVSDTYPETSPGYIGRLEMQRDGNLVLYGKSRLIWNSNTHVAGSHAAYTGNGTLAVYSPAGTVLWHSPSYGGRSALVVNCGSLEFYPLQGTSTFFPSPSKPSNCT